VASVAPPSIGPKLRQARLDRSLSIEETAWRTRIRPDLLRALEDERFEVIGQSSLVRSNLSSYARFLGIDAVAVLQEFTSSQAAPEPSSIEELDRQNRQAPKPKRPKWLVAAIASGVALAVAAGIGALGGQTERPTAKAALAPPRSAAPSNAPSAHVVGPVSPAQARVTLIVVAVAPTLVNIQADGAQIFEGTLAAGESRTFRARTAIDIVAADGGTVRLTLNGVALGLPGPSGTVFRARYGPHGKISPA
jgi:cytoskeleton protein RodZ